MRRLAILAIVSGLGASTGAFAQSTDPATAAALNRAAFAGGGASETLNDGSGLVRWNSSVVGLSGLGAAQGRAIDQLNVSIGQLNLGPGGLPMTLYGSSFDSRSYRVTMTRRWPNLVTFGAGPVNVGVSPEAGVGVDSFGGRTATAGARVELSKDDIARERLNQLGVKDGSVFGDRGRFYLFAAASGRSVGLNMMRNDGDWAGAGWSTDRTSRLTGDQQVGVGWVKGPVQTSFGYVHRDMKADHLLHGVDPHSESMVALSFAIRRH